MTDYVGFSVNDDDDSLFRYGQYWTLGILVALAWRILKYREALDTEDLSSIVPVSPDVYALAVTML